MTDIRFEGDWIHVDSAFLKADAHDLMLDAPSRRQAGGDHRRALVHDFSDGLTVNWDDDYPGGVTLNSARTINGHHGNDWVVVNSRVVQQMGTDLMLDGGPERRRVSAPFRPRHHPYRRALVHGWEDTLVLNWDEDYRGGVVINGRVTMAAGATIAGQDVATALATLTTQVSTASTQIMALVSQVTALHDRITALTSELTDLTLKHKDLEARVTALEAQP